MNCDNIQKWIHLNKTGELNEKEKYLLEEHISTCFSCKELYINMEDSNKIIHNLKLREPELTYPLNLTSNIMQTIAQMESSKGSSFSFNSILELLFSNKLRIVAYTIIIGLIGLFSYQQLTIVNKLNQMEQIIAVKSDKNSELVKTPYSINTKLIKDFASEIENEEILLDKKSLEQFIEVYKNLKTDHDALVQLINDNIKSLERKLSKKDINKLKQLLKEDDLVKKISTNL